MATRASASKTIAPPTREELEAAEDAGAEQAQETKVLEKMVSWRDFADSKLISEADAGLLTQYDRKSKIDQDDLLADQGPQYAATFVRGLRYINDKDTVAYLLTLVYKLLQDDTSARAAHFNSLELKDVARYGPFLTLLSRAAASLGAHGVSATAAAADNYILIKSTVIIATLLGEAGESADIAVVTEFAKFLIGVLAIERGHFRPYELLKMLESVKLFLNNSKAQEIFAREGGLKCFERHFNGSTRSFQLVYVSGFSIWRLTFSRAPVVEEELKRFEVVRHIVDIVQNQLKEKVTRMCFNILRNMMRMPGSSAFLEQLVGLDAGRLFTALSAKKWKDADIPKDIAFVLELLQRKISELSSFEMYVAELGSKSLRWTPVHTEQFWSEHKTRFEEKNFSLIRDLVSILDNSTDETAVEVACYDLGEFARFHPEGKRLISKFGGKTKLMVRMSSDNVKIAKQALLAVQKLMVQNWEFLQKK